MLGFSLLILAGLIVPLIIEGWALQAAAKFAKSTRLTKRRTIAAVIGIFLIGLATASIGRTIPRPAPFVPNAAEWNRPAPHLLPIIGYLAFGVVVTVATFVSIFQLLKHLYALPTSKTFYPFGVVILFQLLSVPLAIFIVRPYIIEAFVIPTGSMEPAIDIGDRFLVNKLEKPRRGDVVAYHAIKGDVFCKRLAGMPGDQIRFVWPELFINGNPKPYRPPVGMPDDPQARGVEQFKYPDGTTITLGPDDYFMVGDHLQTSYDSRYVGPSHRADLVGVVDMIYWPPKRIKFFR